MGALVLLLLAFVAAAVPDLSPRFLGIASHPPDFFVAFAAYLALRGSGTGCVGWAALLGGLKDAVSLDPLGTHAFTLAAVAFLLSRERSGREPIRGLARAGAVGGAVLLAGVLYALRAWPIAGSGAPFAAILHAFPAALWTAVFAPPLLSLLDRTRVLDDVAGRDLAVRP